MIVLEKIDYDVTDRKTQARRSGSILPDGLYTIEAAADALRISRPHVYTLMNRGDLEFVTLGVGGARRVTGASILKFLKAPK